MSADDFRSYGHQLVDWIADYLSHPERYPVLSRNEPGDVKAAVPKTAPEHGEAMEALLADLDRTQLQALLIGLAERDTDLTNAIERQVGLLRLASAAPSSAAISPQARQAGASTRHSAIDQAAIRQQVRFVMRSADRDPYDNGYYDDEGDPTDEVVAGVRPLLEQARGFVAGGDARSALDILSALNDEYLSGYQALAMNADP
jgi:hypothetical protein